MVISPVSGPAAGGTSVTITGTGFVTGAAVTFGGTAATGVNVASATSITATTPAHAAGVVDVVVTNPDTQYGTIPAGFTYTGIPSTTTPTNAPAATLVTSDNDDGFPSVSATPAATQAETFPLMTVTVNIGGDSKAWQAIVTGTKLSELIVTGTVEHGNGDNQTAPPGTVFQYISLVPARFTTITKAVIHFTVPQAWLDENHIDPRSIVLYHQTANGWEALPTTVVSTKDGTVYFSAESTGFSLFAIAGTPAAATPDITTATTFGSVVQEQATTRAIETKAPVTTQTTAPPVASPQPAAPSPLLNIVLVIAAIGILAGGGFMARRWWIRRQNPTLFAEND